MVAAFERAEAAADTIRTRCEIIEREVKAYQTTANCATTQTIDADQVHVAREMEAIGHQLSDDLENCKRYARRAEDVCRWAKEFR